MMTEFMGLHLSVFTLPLVSRLLEDGLISDVEVIRLETRRECRGYNSSPVEHDLSLLLEDQRAEVRDLLIREGETTKLTRDEEAAYLWIRLSTLRSQVAYVADYQFSFEELLDEYDHEDTYADIRFFRPDVRGRRSMETYLSRIDASLAAVRDNINAAAAA